MFAPFNTDITSDTTYGIKRPLVFKLNKLPINDFPEIDIQIGFDNVLSSFSFEITSISRIYHGRSFIFVKNGFLPSALKKPIEGSIIILSLAIFALFAINRLCFKVFIVPEILPKADSD